MLAGRSGRGCLRFPRLVREEEEDSDRDPLIIWVSFEWASNMGTHGSSSSRGIRKEWTKNRRRIISHKKHLPIRIDCNFEKANCKVFYLHWWYLWWPVWLGINLKKRCMFSIERPSSTRSLYRYLKKSTDLRWFKHDWRAELGGLCGTDPPGRHAHIYISSRLFTWMAKNGKRFKICLNILSRLPNKHVAKNDDGHAIKFISCVLSCKHFWVLQKDFTTGLILAIKVPPSLPL